MAAIKLGDEWIFEADDTNARCTLRHSPSGNEYHFNENGNLEIPSGQGAVLNKLAASLNANGQDISNVGSMDTTTLSVDETQSDEHWTYVGGGGLDSDTPIDIPVDGYALYKFEIAVDTGSGTEPTLMSLNNHTNSDYNYTTRSGGSFSEYSGETHWKLYQTGSKYDTYHGDYRLYPAKDDRNNREYFIHGTAAGQGGDPVLHSGRINGDNFGKSLDSIQFYGNSNYFDESYVEVYKRKM